MLDVAPYVGLPFLAHGRDRAGLDCWGLVRLVLAEQRGFTLPSYAEGYATTTDRVEIPKLVAGEIANDWTEIPATDAQPFDVVLLRVLGQPLHVGLVVAPPQFLHVMTGLNACLDDWSRPHWNRRVLGFYRHRGRDGA